LGGGGLGKDFGGGAAFVAPVEWFGVGVGEVGVGAGEVGGNDGEEGPEFLCFGGRWVGGWVHVSVCVHSGLCLCACVVCVR